jgi:hypothetical protein
MTACRDWGSCEEETPSAGWTFYSLGQGLLICDLQPMGDRSLILGNISALITTLDKFTDIFILAPGVKLKARLKLQPDTIHSDGYAVCSLLVQRFQKFKRGFSSNTVFGRK